MKVSKNTLFYILGIVVISVCVISSIITIINHPYKYKKSSVESTAESIIRESELQYFATKSELVNAVQNYIDSIAPTSDLRASILVDGCEKYSIDIKFVLAQGEIESHFGTKGLASKTNSVWNVGAYTDMTLSEILKKYKYAHPNESIEPYLKLLSTKYLVKDVEEGLLNNFVDIHGNRFAEDKHYEERLRFKYKSLCNTKIDSLQDKTRYWAIKSNR